MPLVASEASFWPSACSGSSHEAQLSHLRTGEGLLRRLRELAEPPPHAGGNARLVLCRLLSGL